MEGKKFNRLTVLEYSHKKGGKKYYLCECSCGNKTYVRQDKIKSGHTKSCGCLMKESSSRIGKNKKTHGKTDTAEYMVWCDMKSRCFNDKNIAYKNYGGRGITVCDRWKKSFNNFYEDMGDRPTNKHQLDRKDNDGNYSPSNCRWVTPSENSVNRRNKGNNSGIKNIHKDGNKYYVVVTRDKIKRISSYTSLENAIKLKNLYIEEYKENKSDWVKNTLKNNYKKVLTNHNT